MTRAMRDRKLPMRLLLVDDDEIDVLGMQRTLRAMDIAAEVTVAHDGMRALEILRGGRGAPDSIEPPYLIVLDLNMPRMTGLEFLDQLRRDEKLRHSVVFVLSTSATEVDIRKAYDRNVAAYIQKSTGSESIRQTIKLLERYWHTVELP
ncbi:MAG: response regulator [Pseudomonadota bacterium]